MDELSREEVLHVANLGKLYLDEEDIEKYKIQLKQIMDEVNKIRDLDIIESDILISPSDNINMFSDYKNNEIDRERLLSNSCNRDGNFIEVRWFNND